MSNSGSRALTPFQPGSTSSSAPAVQHLDDMYWLHPAQMQSNPGLSIVCELHAYLGATRTAAAGTLQALRRACSSPPAAQFCRVLKNCAGAVRSMLAYITA